MDVRADIYSLGATLYHMLTGQVPFHGNSPMDVMIKHRVEDALPAHVANPSVSLAASSVVAKMMQKKPEDRYQTPMELLDDLIEVYHGRNPDHAELLG